MAAKSRPPQGMIGRAAHGIQEANVVVEGGGKEWVIDPQNVHVDKGPGNESLIILEKLRLLSKLPKAKIEEKLDGLKLLTPGQKNSAWLAAALKVQGTTLKDYWKNIREFKAFLEQNGSLKQTNWKIFYMLVGSNECEAILEQYLHDLVQKKKKEKNGLIKVRTSINYVREILQVKKFYKKGRSINFIQNLASKYLRKPKRTNDIPYKILLEFFKFLEDTDPFAHKIFFVAFNCSSRASEIINLKVEDVKFENEDWEMHPHVKLEFKRTKTRKDFVDDFHLVTHYQNKNEGQHCLYLIMLQLYNTAKERKHPYILSLFSKTNSDTRKAQFYVFFDKIKTDFDRHLKENRGWNFDIKNIRFHSFRTTFIGLMALWGMSWDQIKLKTGHKFDAETARNTYFANSLMTHGFDKSFGEIMENNEQAKKLFSKPSQETKKNVRKRKALPPSALKRIPKKQKTYSKKAQPTFSQEEMVYNDIAKQIDLPFIELSPLEDKRPKNKRLKPATPEWFPQTPEDPGSSEDDTFPEMTSGNPGAPSPKYNPETSTPPYTFDDLEYGEPPNFASSPKSPEIVSLTPKIQEKMV